VKGRGVAVLAVLGVLVVAAFLAGCGSDSSSNASATDKSPESTAAESTSGPLTKAEFIKQASQICRKGVAKKEEAVLSLAKLAAEGGKPPSQQAVEKLATVVIFPTYNDILDQMAQLEPPQGDEAKIQAIITKYEADLKTAEAEPIKASKENLFADANDLGEAYGLESCTF
jgi:hypothetical protein